MTGQLTPIETVRAALTRMQPEFQAALPAQITPEKFLRTTLTAIQMQPDLLQADRRSLFGAIMRCAQDGLLPDGRDAALVIYRSRSGPTVQYLPMIAGLVRKLYKSKSITNVAAHVIHEFDEFTYELGDDERIVHKPAFPHRGKPIGVYATATTTYGAKFREVMSYDEVEKVRSVSRAKGSGPWSDWWEEMAKKTVLRRLIKRLPQDDGVDAVIESDNATYQFREPKPEPQADPGNKMRELILAKNSEPEEPAAEELEKEPAEPAQESDPFDFTEQSSE